MLLRVDYVRCVADSSYSENLHHLKCLLQCNNLKMIRYVGHSVIFVPDGFLRIDV